MSNKIDLSSFPLLRLDQLHQHQIEVLLQAKVELASIPQSKDDLGIYVTKLAEAINNEIARRSIERFTRSSSKTLDAVEERNDFQNQFTETWKNVKHDNYHHDSKKQTRNQSTSKKGTEFKSHHFISSPIGNHKPNFISRSKEAVLSLKTKKEMMLNDKENKLHKLLQDKEKRRKEAVERMRDRKARQEWFRNQLELKVKAKQESKKKRQAAQLKLIADMERAAADATTALNENGSNILSLEERLILGANAATRVMEENSCDVASSNSGSSLASEVDVESVYEIELQELQSSGGCGKFPEEYEHNYQQNQVSPCVQGQDGFCGVVDSIHFSSVTSQISQSAEDIQSQISNCDGNVKEYCEPNKQRDQDSDSVQSQEGCISIHHDSEDFKHTELTRKVQVNSAQNVDAVPCMVKQNGDKHASHNDISYETNTDNPVNLQPWKPWNSVFASNEQVEQGNTTSNETKLSDIFPNFRNIFSAFMNSNSCVMSEIDCERERECLAYQINVGNGLSEVIFNGIEGAWVDKTKRFFKVKSPRNEVNSIVQDVLLSFPSGDDAWEDISNQVGIGNCWNLLWTWSKPKINREHLLAFQKVSRFNGVTCLTRKDLLKKRLEQHRTTASLMPQTFVLPQQYNSFISSFSGYQKLDLTFHPNIWIMKPVGMSRGRGITLIDDIVDVAYASPTVIQKYITNPLLYDGFKFDLRLYVLVTSFNPLEAFIYREGLARFGSRRFSTTSTNLKDHQVHLTNSSIQKEYDDDILSSHPSRMAGKLGGGNKTSLKWLLNQLQKLGIDTTSLWKEISKLCLQTLRAVDTLILNQPNSFEVFGFDVIIDSELKPWLIEVNACPSLARESVLDMDVKEALIRDTIKIVQPCKFDRSALFQICKRRLNQRKRSMQASGTDRQELERDLKQIFGDHRPRIFGEMPKEDTDFERLSPAIDK
jgi:hypothetical protein